MGYLVAHPKICKRPRSQLESRVRKSRPREILRPCPLNCKSSNALRISFFTHTRKNYLDSSSSSLIGREQEATGEATICVDNRLFFRGHHVVRNYVTISQVLDSLNVKKYLHDKITSQILSMGDCKYKDGKKMKKKIFKGLVVDLTLIQTFLGDQDSVRDLFFNSMEEIGMEPSEKGVHFVR